MSEFELRTLIYENSGFVTDQFQFWMAATFAVVIASYTAGDRLAPWARISIAVLYTLAVALFLSRFLGAADEILVLLQRLSDIGAEPYYRIPPLFVATLRIIVIFGGSILAIVLICKPTVGDVISSDRDGPQ